MSCVSLEKVIELAKRCGLIILENGGETYRAEETVSAIFKSTGYSDVSVMAMPTACFFTVTVNGVSESSVVRISRRKVDLALVNYVNAISHDLADGQLDVDGALQKLDGHKTALARKKLLSYVGFSVCAAGFCGMFGGDWIELITAFVTGIVAQLLSDVFSNMGLPSFFTSFFGGALAAGAALLSDTVAPGLNISSIIIGVIMPLLPGLALTNCIRDIMNGDLVSGSARLTEALLTGGCIAVGAGIIMFIYTSNGGVIL